MKSLIFNTLLSLILFTLTPVIHAAEYEIHHLSILKVDSSINPAIKNYISTEFKKLNQRKNVAALIKMDTPGGLVSTTKEIMTEIGEANFPVIIWITPEGASATSAGAIIASSAHILVMSEGTNIGAATPITMNGDIGGKKAPKENELNKDISKELKDELIKAPKSSDARAKAINDLVALVTALSKSRGRNPEAFSKMISEAASFDNQVALEKGIIDGVVSSQVKLLDFINDRSIKIKGTEYTIKTKPGMSTEIVELDPGQALLNIFANPTTAYILFIIGAALLYFEFQAPGGFIAGGLGAVFIVLAGIGFQVLPMNIGALGLILLSFILFIIEIYVTSYGILTLGGIASLVFGSLFLFRTENAYLQIQMPVVLAVVAAIVLYVLVIGFVFIKMKRKKGEHFLTMEGDTGVITRFDREEQNEFFYQIKINGEIWKAKSKNKYDKNTKVKVITQDNDHMILTLE
jgi:membrane-bound serine protease (ClpP class)